MTQSKVIGARRMIKPLIILFLLIAEGRLTLLDSEWRRIEICILILMWGILMLLFIIFGKRNLDFHRRGAKMRLAMTVCIFKFDGVELLVNILWGGKIAAFHVNFSIII